MNPAAPSEQDGPGEDVPDDGQEPAHHETRTPPDRTTSSVDGPRANSDPKEPLEIEDDADVSDPGPTAIDVVDPGTVDLDLFGRPAPQGRDWSHRRGEPRIFAFFWTLYLLFATIVAFWSVGAPGSHDPLAMRPAARSLLAAITVGVVLLWPMTRLSQTSPSEKTSRIAKAVFQDMLVVLVPAQAIVWPQIAMAGWPIEVVAALAASLAGWTLVVGAVLATGLTVPAPGRAWWMLVLVALAGAGPLVALGPLGGSPDHADFTYDWWWMTSPVTSGFEIARDRAWTGAAAAVTEGHWRAIMLTAWSGAIGWVLFGFVGLFRRSESA